MSLDHTLVDLAFANATPSPTGWWRATCPYCPLREGTEDRRKSFSILVGLWIFHCFRCHVGGRLKRAPAGGAGMKAPLSEDGQPLDVGPPEDFLPLSEEPARSAMSARAARQYLFSRGVRPATWHEVGIGVCLTGRNSGRIIVPVKADDTWLGWVGRVWQRVKRGTEYRYPLGMRRGELLFNAAALKRETTQPAFVVEGVFDALPHWPNAVACLGKPTAAQRALLLEARRPICVALDGDAWEEGEALALGLSYDGAKAGYVKLPPRMDPGDYSPDELRGFRQLEGW